MSVHAQSFTDYLVTLSTRDRGALAVLRRSLSHPPGAYPAAFPIVERFVPAQGGRHSYRSALYLVAGLFALHPKHRSSVALGAQLCASMRERGSASIEGRFVAALSATPEGFPSHLRQLVSLLAADNRALDYASLLDDCAAMLDDYRPDGRDRVVQRWARDFYRAIEAPGELSPTRLPGGSGGAGSSIQS